MDTYVPIFDSECKNCGHSPVVGVVEPVDFTDKTRIRSTGLCGRDFFQDRSMIYWELWNEPQEGTE